MCKCHFICSLEFVVKAEQCRYCVEVDRCRERTQEVDKDDDCIIVRSRLRHRLSTPPVLIYIGDYVTSPAASSAQAITMHMLSFVAGIGLKTAYACWNTEMGSTLKEKK